MPPITSKAIHFGSFLVTPQVFYITPLSFCLVNIKPIVPGHILICPLRAVPRISNLSAAEMTDLFATVHRVSRTLERVYNASALNIAIQDGADAGQSVKHVHVHILPRRKGDMGDAEEDVDKVYKLMDGEEGDLESQFSGEESSRFRVDASVERRARGEEEMRVEAEWLADEMRKDEVGS